MEEIDIDPSEIESIDTPKADISFSRPKPVQQEAEIDIDPSDIEIVDTPSDTTEDIGFFTPKENLNTTYVDEKAKYAKKLQTEYETSKALDDAYNAELMKQRYAHRRERARVAEGELEESNPISGFFNNSKHTTESISNKWNSLKKQGMSDSDIKFELRNLGVTDNDLRKTIRYRSGQTDELDTTIESVYDTLKLLKDGGREVGKWGAEFINGLSAMAGGLEDTISELHPLNVINNMVQGRLPFDRSQGLQDYFDKNRALVDAKSEEWKRQRHGAGSFADFAGRYSLDAATMGYNPSGLAKMALTAGALTMPTSKMEGYDTAQTIAMSTLAVATVGTLGLISDNAPKFINYINNRQNMPKDLKRTWNAIKAKSGLSDSEMKEMLKAYSKEFKTEGVNPDVVASNFLMHIIANKHLSAAGHQGKLGSVYEQTLISNPRLVQSVKDSFTARAKELDSIGGKSPLGKLVKRNRTGTKDEGIAINWAQLKDDIINNNRNNATGQFDLNSPLIKRIFKYADMYESNDIGAQIMLKNIKHNNLTVAEEIENLAVAGAKVVATKELAKAAGTQVLPKISVFSKAVDLVAKFVPRMKDSKAVSDFITKQLEKGVPLNPKLLADDLRTFQAIAPLSDKRVDDLVEQVVKLSQETDMSARKAKLDKQLKELKASTKEHKLAMAEEANNVQFARVALDEAVASGDKEAIKQAKRDLYDAQVEQRRVQAQANKEINLNEDMSQKLTNSPLPEVPKEAMSTILRQFDDNGKAMKPSEFITPKPQGPTEPQVVTPKAEVPKVVETPKMETEVQTPSSMITPKAKPVETPTPTKESLESSKLNDKDIEVAKNSMRGLREKNGVAIFGKEFMKNFNTTRHKEVIDKYGVHKTVKVHFSDHLGKALKDGEVSREDVMKYYYSNASIGTLTQLEDKGISGVTGAAKKLHRDLEQSGISLEEFKKYMKDLSYVDYKPIIDAYTRVEHGMAISDGMKKFLSEAPTNFNNMPVHRGTLMTKDELGNFSVGDTVSNSNVLSTSKSRKIANQFSKQSTKDTNRVNIYIKNASGHDISNISTADEAEVVLNSGKAFKVVTKNTNGKVTNITLEEVPPPKGQKLKSVRL